MKCIIVILLLISVLQVSGQFTYTFEDLGIGTIHIGSLDVQSSQANFSLPREGLANITIVIYSSVNTSTAMMRFKINDKGGKIDLQNGMVTKSILVNVYENENTLWLQLINLGIGDIIVFSNSCIIIEYAETESQSSQSITPYERTYWLAALIIAYTVPLIIAYKLRGKEQEQLVSQEEVYYG